MVLLLSPQGIGGGSVVILRCPEHVVVIDVETSVTEENEELVE